METDYNEIWEEICFILSENVNAGMTENVYEQRVIMALEKLGWSQFKKEIQTQKSLTIGRQSTIRPDIVLYGSDHKALVAIEVKRPAEKLASLEQLKSYMRQMKADFGLLVGHEIRIYYDGILNPNPEPLQLSKVSFEPALQDGRRFVELFTKANFLLENYKPFLNKKISQFNLKREVAKIKRNICKQETKTKILEFLRSEYSETSQDIVSEALKDLKIDIYYEQETPVSRPSPPKYKKRSPPQPTPPEEAKWIATCKNKATGECFIYIEENGQKPQVIAPNGRFIPFDEERFSLPQDEEKIEDLLSSGKVSEDQIKKYKAYRASIRRTPKRTTVVDTGSPFQIPHGVPKKLSHTLEMIYEVRKRGMSRVQATRAVAERCGTTTQTILDKYCRQLGKNTAEIDRLLQDPELVEFRSLLERKYAVHKQFVTTFFEDLQSRR